MAEEQTLTPREQMLARAGKRYPDRRFAGQVGEDGVEGTDDLEQAILDMLAEDEQTITNYQDKSQTLAKMLREDPQVGEFVSRWVESGEPRGALVETFGDDLEGISTEEGRAKFQQQLTDWRARRDEARRIEEERENKWQTSLDALDAWGNENGLDNEQKAQLMAKLLDIAAAGLMLEFTDEDFEFARKAINYDADVEAARAEGVVAGRNEKIEAQRLERGTASAMAPALAGGKGIRTTPERIEKPKSVWDEIE